MISPVHYIHHLASARRGRPTWNPKNANLDWLGRTSLNFEEVLPLSSVPCHVSMSFSRDSAQGYEFDNVPRVAQYPHLKLLAATTIGFSVLKIASLEHLPCQPGLLTNASDWGLEVMEHF